MYCYIFYGPHCISQYFEHLNVKIQWTEFMRHPVCSSFACTVDKASYSRAFECTLNRFILLKNDHQITVQ